MSVLTGLVTSLGPLLGVVIGGWLTSRTQAVSATREAQRHLWESRRAAYNQFLDSARQYAAYIQSPGANITAVTVNAAGTSIPVLDDAGTPVRHEMDAAHVGVRLVAASTATVVRAHDLARALRQTAVARAEHPAGAVPAETFNAMWAAERRFVDAARSELGLGEIHYEG